MCVIKDPEFTKYLLRIRDGAESIDLNDNITLPRQILILFIDKDQSLL